jgi:peptidoglycan hydrolase-like amidase
LLLWSLIVGSVTVVSTLASGGGSVTAAPPGDGQVVAYLARGVGNGHGRGLSQWGAFGRAVNAGQSWTGILDTYYGGTHNGSGGDANFRVRLTGWDNAAALGVISPSGKAHWNGSTGYSSLHAVETTPNKFTVYGSTSLGCSVTSEPAAGWQVLAPDVTGPIVFTTSVAATAAPGEVLGVCRSSGSIAHYRGSISLLHTGDGNRVVNQLDVELYLRGVIPREVPASWGSSGNGAGMNALRAQAVAARSYALSQNRYPTYARTCDTSSCQVYGGSQHRPSPTSPIVDLPVEHALTNQAIADTAGTVRLWNHNNAIVSTEFSASNGPRTAGGSFPPVDDPWDDVSGNPLHQWTRVIDADAIASRYGLSDGNSVATVRDTASMFDGIWANKVVRGSRTLASAWDFRNAFGLPSPGFELVPITRGVTSRGSLAFIGDSVGVSVAATDASELRVLLDGVFPSATWDSIVSRRTQGGTTIPDGVSAANAVPLGTDLVVVELGYNDDPKSMAARIDAVMAALRGRQVRRVAWVNVSERRSQFAATNAAIAAARDRWSELFVFDWESASDHDAAHRWFSDNVHLTSTGRAEFAMFLRDSILPLAAGSSPRTVTPGTPLRVPVLDRAGVPGSGVVGVALNVTAVDPADAGWLRVWPCGSPEPETSSVNYAFAGAVEPNAVVVPVDSTGEVCVGTMTATEVVVDVSGWFDDSLNLATGRLIDTRDD